VHDRGAGEEVKESSSSDERENDCQSTTAKQARGNGQSEREELSNNSSKLEATTDPLRPHFNGLFARPESSIDRELREMDM